MPYTCWADAEAGQPMKRATTSARDHSRHRAGPRAVHGPARPRAVHGPARPRAVHGPARPRAVHGPARPRAVHGPTAAAGAPVLRCGRQSKDIDPFTPATIGADANRCQGSVRILTTHRAKKVF